MLSVFCLRLAGGMAASLLLLSPRIIGNHFYRTHCLIAFGLTCLVTLFSWSSASWLLLGLLIGASIFALAGSVVWSFEGSPFGQTFIVLTAMANAAVLALLNATATSSGFSAEIAAQDLTSAALLGTSMTAMLIGHSYLIAPGMSLTPLFRLLGALGFAVLARMGVEGYVLWSWTADHSFGNLGNDVLLFLPVRWGVGLLGPLVLGAMAWQTARIRSTQSATGILYVVVILCFVGELTSQLLQTRTGYTL
jgi:hypothetical protein